MTQICVSLTEETTAGIGRPHGGARRRSPTCSRSAPTCVLDLDLLTILRAQHAAARSSPAAPVSEGGRWPDDDPRRRLTLLEAVKRGFDYVDVELHERLPRRDGREGGRRARRLPPRPRGHARRPRRPLRRDGATRGADIVKIVVTPRSIADVGRLLAFAARVRDERRARRSSPSPWVRWASSTRVAGRPLRRALHLRLRGRRARRRPRASSRPRRWPTSTACAT